MKINKTLFILLIALYATCGKEPNYLVCDNIKDKSKRERCMDRKDEEWRECKKRQQFERHNQCPFGCFC